MKSKKKWQIPNVYIFLLGLIFICSLLSYIVPAGSYDMVDLDGRMVVDPNSYHSIEQTPVSPMQMLTSITRGLQQSSQIVFFLFVVGGSMAVIQSTGALEAGVGRLAKSLKDKNILMIPIILCLFSLGGAIFGMVEEAVPFVPLFIAICLAMGYDSLTGFAIVMLGGALGYAGEFMNPFSLQVAQKIAELPALSGMNFRIIFFVVLMIVASLWVIRYALKIKKNPELSLVYEIDKGRSDTLDMENLPEFDGRKKGVVAVFVLMIFLLVYGVIKLGWYMDEISALFLGAAIICAIIAKTGFNRFAEVLGQGMSDIAMGGIIVGFSRAILVVLMDGNIMHVFLHRAAVILGTLPPVFSAIGMYIVQNLINFVVVSGSGQASLTMPIMAPLADLVGVTRQTAVLAFSIGNGLSNVLTPVSGPLMAGLALAKIPWEKWIKYIIPLLAIQFVIGMIFVIIAQFIQYGPF